MMSPTEINRTILQSIQFIESASNRNVANEMVDVIIFLCQILVKLKHLLPVYNKKTQKMSITHHWETSTSRQVVCIAVTINEFQ